MHFSLLLELGFRVSLYAQCLIHIDFQRIVFFTSFMQFWLSLLVCFIVVLIGILFLLCVKIKFLSSALFLLDKKIPKIQFSRQI